MSLSVILISKGSASLNYHTLEYNSWMEIISILMLIKINSYENIKKLSKLTHTYVKL